MRIRCLLLIGLLSNLMLARATDAAAPADPDTEPPAESAEAALLAIEQIDGATPDGQRRLVALMNDRAAPSAERCAAIGNLASRRVATPEVQSAVLGLVSEDTDKFVCRAAIFALPKVSAPADDAVPVLLRALNDSRNCSLRQCSSGLIYCGALDVLGEYGTQASDAAPVLNWALTTAPYPSLPKQQTEHTLGLIAPEQFPFYAWGEAAIPLMIKALNSDIDFVAERAAERLLLLHEHARPATAALEGALNHRSDDVRLAAAVGLLAMGEHADATRIVELLADPSDLANHTTARQVSKLIGWHTVYKLQYDASQFWRALLKSPDAQTRGLAAGRLARVRKYESEALAEALRLYESGEQREQVASLNALKLFRPELLAPHHTMVRTASEQPGTVGYVGKRVMRLIPAQPTEPQLNQAAGVIELQ